MAIESRVRVCVVGRRLKEPENTLSRKLSMVQSPFAEIVRQGTYRCVCLCPQARPVPARNIK